MEKDIINNLLVNLTAAFRNIQLYAPQHPLVGKSITKTIDALNGFIEEAGGTDELTFMVVENELIVKGFQFDKLPSCALNLAMILTSKGIERLSLLRGLEIDELTRFAASFVTMMNVDAIKASNHIKIGKVKLKTRNLSEEELTESQEQEGEGDYEVISKEKYMRILDMYSSAKRHKKLDIVGVESIVGQFMKTFKKELSPLLAMASLKSFDEYTYVHAANVCILTMAQAESLGLKDKVLHDIGIAAMVHDVGKTFIPDEILNKQGKLSKEEWDIMQSHPAQGAKYLSETPGVPNIAVLVAFEHHMKGDFSGYPKVDKSYKIHPCSQITNIADVFDALSTVRPYRQPMPREKIFSILREGAGTEYDTFLLENFIAMIEASM